MTKEGFVPDTFGFDPKNNILLLFLSSFVGATLNKNVTIATMKSLSIISKSEILANIYL